MEKIKLCKKTTKTFYLILIRARTNGMWSHSYKCSNLRKYFNRNEKQTNQRKNAMKVQRTCLNLYVNKLTNKSDDFVDKNKKLIRSWLIQKKNKNSIQTLQNKCYRWRSAAYETKLTGFYRKKKPLKYVTQFQSGRKCDITQLKLLVDISVTECFA